MFFYLCSPYWSSILFLIFFSTATLQHLKSVSLIKSCMARVCLQCCLSKQYVKLLTWQVLAVSWHYWPGLWRGPRCKLWASLLSSLISTLNIIWKVWWMFSGRNNCAQRQGRGEKIVAQLNITNAHIMQYTVLLFWCHLLLNFENRDHFLPLSQSNQGPFYKSLSNHSRQGHSYLSSRFFQQTQTGQDTKGIDPHFWATGQVTDQLLVQLLDIILAVKVRVATKVRISVSQDPDNEWPHQSCKLKFSDRVTLVGPFHCPPP